MEFATIPGTSLRVSRVGLGTWAIGGWMWGGTDEEKSVQTISAAVERGVNLIDTAPAYGFGRSEEIVGRAIAEGRLRSRVFIATKVGLEWTNGKVFRNASRDRILCEATDSLRRLRTDYIDIYQVHWPDPLVPIDETAEAMQTLFDQGKIRAIGVSNFSVLEIARFRRVAKLHVVQPPYNLFERKIEKEFLPYCRESGLATLTYGALCRGLLSGKLQVDAHFEGDVALWGARHPGQLQAIDEVFGWSLGAAAKIEIDRILRESITEPVGPEFMAPPPRPTLAALEAAE
jgi:aryl-alcohol dehydrogenase-like predicted oxidoreductase